MLKLGILDVDGTKFHLKTGQEYTLGRKSNEYHHDIEINDQSVDIKHSIIDLTQSSPQLFDVSSKNGTFVEGLKIARFQSVSLSKSVKIRFGNVETYLQLYFEGDSGYLEGKPSSPLEDTSEIICNSPEPIVASGSRLKNSLKTSLTSTPNASAQAASQPTTTKPITNFLIPSAAPRYSKGSNTSARSSDSFYIPETQHPAEANSRTTNNSTDNVSFYSNRSKQNSTVGDDDFFIPETQEVASSAIPLQNHARVAFPSDDVNETISQEDRIPSSQFRICTQDFNGTEEGDLSDSSDILANIPFSLPIPTIQFEPVVINDFACGDGDDEIDKEMSALQWSKKTLEENADGSVTPDGLLDIVGSVTSDLMQRVRKSSEKADSQCSTPDIFANPQEPTTSNIQKLEEKVESGEIKEEEVAIVAKEEDPPQNIIEPDFQPTQVFVRPVPVTKSIEKEDNLESKEGLPAIDPEFLPTQVFVRPVPVRKSITMPPVVEKEENKIPADLNDSLPATQVFSPSLIRPKPVVPSSATKHQNVPLANEVKLGSGLNHVFAAPLASPKPRASINPQPPLVASNDDDDDLPPTQVFLKEEHAPPPIVPNVCFSSTLVESQMQLSENSFRRRCNKLLDSDDDEMDEVIAPELVKQMRQSLDKLAQQPLDQVIEDPSPEPEPEEPLTSSKQTKDNVPAEADKPMITPERSNNFNVPVKASKSTYSTTAAVNMDDFMLTPDFLSKALPKNSQLKEAEVKWMNIVLEKQRQNPLFGDVDEEDENLDYQSSEGSSQDGFLDLLPKKRETRSKSRTRNLSEKMEKQPKVDPEEVCGRITRRRATAKSAAEKEVTKKETRKSRARKEDSTNSEKNSEQANVGESKKTRGKKKKGDSTTTSKEDSKDSERIVKETKPQEAEKRRDESAKEFKDDLKSGKEAHANKESSNIKPNLYGLVKDSSNASNSSLGKSSSLVKEVVEDPKNDIPRSSKEDLKTKKDTKLSRKDTSREKEAIDIKEKVKDLFVKTNAERDLSPVKDAQLSKHPSRIERPNLQKEKIANKLEKPTKSSSKIRSTTTKETIESNSSSSLSKEPSFSRTNSFTKQQSGTKEPSIVEATEDVLEKNQTTSRTRRRNRQQVEEPIKVEGKSRAVKRNVEVTKTSSKASKINKLEGFDVTSRKTGEKPSPRITRLRSGADLKEKKEVVKKEPAKKEAPKKETTVVKKEATTVQKKVVVAKKEAIKKEDPTKKEAIKTINSLVDQTVDLTNSDIEDPINKTIEAGTAKKRKSQEDESMNKRSKSMISGSQSSVDSGDSNRSLRRKAKLKIAISSCSPSTRSTLVRYSGRIWVYTEDPKECDVLIIEAGNRTYKLLVAIARGVSVVNVSWLKDVIQLKSTDVPFDKHIYDEPNFQKRHQFVMRDVLQLAKSRSLFHGMNFMMTPNITPKPDEMKDIISCAGGTVLHVIPTSQDIQPLYLVSENIDNNHWHKYRRACPKIKIVTAIALMSSVMQQSLDALLKSIH